MAKMNGKQHSKWEQRQNEWMHLVSAIMVWYGMVWCKNERHQFNYDKFKEFLQIAFALQKYKPPYSIIMLSTILQVNERKRERARER